MLGGVSDAETSKFIVGCSVVALVWAAWQFWILTGTKIDMPHTGDEEKTSLSQTHTTIRQLRLLKEVHNAISTGAEAFLRAEYGYCGAFIFVFAIVIYSLISWGQTPTLGALTTLAFVMGALTSILSGYIGMKVAVYANARTTIECQQGNPYHSTHTCYISCIHQLHLRIHTSNPHGYSLPARYPSSQ